MSAIKTGLNQASIDGFTRGLSGKVNRLAGATTKVAQGRSTTTDFLIILLAIVVGWILVALWTRVIDNFTYIVLGLDERSAWHAMIVALTVTFIFVIAIGLIDQYNLVPGGVTPDIESQVNPVS